MLRNHVCLPLPPCPCKSMERGGGTLPRSVVGKEKPPPPPSLRRGGGGGSSQPQPDTLEDKSPPSPSHLRLKIPSYHHVDDWGEGGEDRVPSTAPSLPQAKRRREERERGTDRSRGPDFQEKFARRRSPTRERPQPHGHDRRAAPARPRSPRCGHCPQGTRASIRASYALIMSRLSSARTYLARWTKRSTPTPSPTRFGNGLKPTIAHTRGNRTHHPDHTRACRLHHQVDTSDSSRSWAPQPRDSTTRPAPADPYHRAPQPPGHTEPRDHRTTWYGLDHPARDRRHEAQRPPTWSSATASVRGSTARRSRLRSQATQWLSEAGYPPPPPPARSRHPPVHTISDSDSSDAEARSQWSSPRSPPSKAPHRAEDTLPGYRQRSASGFPKSPHGYYESKQASAYPSEPQPPMSRDQTYAWPPAPRDFDNDRTESLASTEDEPDYSFAAVIDMIRTFHDIEKPATATPARTATVFDQMRGLQSDRAPVFHLPTSPLLGGLIDDVNSTLARLVEDQTSDFMPLPCRHPT